MSLVAGQARKLRGGGKGKRSTTRTRIPKRAWRKFSIDGNHGFEGKAALVPLIRDTHPEWQRDWPCEATATDRTGRPTSRCQIQVGDSSGVFGEDEKKPVRLASSRFVG